MEATSGIYQIVNTVNGHKYVGSAKKLSNRKNVHVCELRNKQHGNGHLQRAWDKYGEKCFEFSVLEICDINLLIEREQYYIDTLHPEYNISPKAGNCLGLKHTEESRKNMSIAHKGNIPSQETREKMSRAQKGKIISQETRNKLSRYHTGRSLSQETKNKISLKKKGRKMPGCHTSLGYKHTPEAKAKISAASIGNKRALGYHHTQSARDRISASLMGNKRAKKIKDIKENNDVG
jgi:group I intron endonuclease